MIYIHKTASPLGPLVMVSDSESLTGLWFERQTYFPQWLDKAVPNDNLPVFDLTCRWLKLYFGGQIPDFTPPLKPEGTPFRLAVWDILRTIPYGQTMTYGEIARKLETQGMGRMSAQAVGGAVGHNPIGIIIPCHRVMGAGGNLTGYAGGIDKKVKLLAI